MNKLPDYLFPNKIQTLGSPDEIGLVFFLPVLRVVDEQPVVCQPPPLVLGSEPVLSLLPFLYAPVTEKAVQVVGIHTQRPGNLRHRHASFVTLVFALQCPNYNAICLIHNVIVRYQQVANGTMLQTIVFANFLHNPI